MSKPTKRSKEDRMRERPTREERRFNLVLRTVFVALVVMIIIMTLIWQLATPGSVWY